jgi:hypothetical protein
MSLSEANTHIATDISHRLYESQSFWRVHDDPSLDPLHSHTNPVHILAPRYFKV